MIRSNVTSLVNRMPFDGKRIVRPAALRGAMAARHGDMAALAESDRHIREVTHANWLFAGIGAAILGENTVLAVKNGSAVQGAEATFGGLVAAGHTAAVYTQYRIREQLQNIAARAQTPVEVSALVPAGTAPEEPAPALDQAEAYPSFYTPPPRFSRSIDAAVTYGSVAALGHSIVGLLQQVGQ
jgi:hypothetical protein